MLLLLLLVQFHLLLQTWNNRVSSNIFSTSKYFHPTLLELLLVGEAG